MSVDSSRPRRLRQPRWVLFPVVVVVLAAIGVFRYVRGEPLVGVFVDWLLEVVVVGALIEVTLRLAAGSQVRLRRELAEELRAEEGLDRHVAQLAMLNDIGRQIATVFELDSALDRATALVREGFGSHRVALFAVDRERDELVMRAKAGSYPAPFPQDLRIAMGQGMVGWVGRHGQKLVANDVRTEPRYVNPFPGLVPALAELCLPIQVAGNVLGVLDVQSTQLGAFEQDDVAVLETLASQVAIALENARLHEAAQQELARRQETEQTLQASEARYRTLVEQIPAVIYVTSFSESGTQFYISPQIERILGFSQTEWADGPRLWLAQLHPQDRVRVLTELARCYDSGESLSSEYRLLTHDGRVLWFRDEATIVRNRGGNPVTLQGVRLDITKRKRAEEALEEERANLARRVEERTAELSTANAELARAARLKDEFLANMSHELRTPLNAVLGLSEALQEEVYGPLNERQLKSLSSIEESGRHLLSLITDILDVAKIGAGKLKLQTGPVAVDSLCKSSVGLIKQLAHSKQIKVSSTCDSMVSTIVADERRLKQVLVNLLSNAVKFTPEGGEVGLEVGADAKRKVVQFAVWDTGIGISQEEIGRLFQPFVQLDSGLSRRHPGTGLGLAMVRSLTDLHGGSVSLESTLGEGSRFTVTLPWQGSVQDPGSQGTNPSSALSEPVLPLAPGTSPLVLIAEDNEDNITTVSDYLLARGCRIVVARNGLEAVERAREVSPDIILMDMQMPEMDGLEATRRLRAAASPGLAGVPIIALTALAMPGDRERCLEAGADEYLSKPVGLKRLVEVIQRQVNR